MGNVTQKKNSTNMASTNNVGSATPNNNLATAPSNTIYERIIMNGKNFSVTLNYRSISQNSPKKFIISGEVVGKISFIRIGNGIYLLLERTNGCITFTPNEVYSVKLTSRNRLSHTRDLKVDQMSLYISQCQLKEYEWIDGSLVFFFEKKVIQNSTAGLQRSAQPMPTLSQQRLIRPSSVSFPQGSSQTTSTLTQRTLTQPSSVTSQQGSSQITSTLTQQTLTQPSSVTSLQRSAQPLTISSHQRQSDKLKFEEIHRSSDNSFANGKFRLTVGDLTNLVQQRAPLFTFDNMQIGFTVSKHSRNNANESLRVILYHKDLNGGSLAMESKLISYISRNPIVKKVNRSNVRNKNTCSDMISWNLLFTSPNKFVQNDSCVMEVEIKIGKNRAPMAQTGRQNNSSCVDRPPVRASGRNNSSSMECPICMDDMSNKSKSSTSCGHIYCTPCIARSLQQKSTCPLCNNTVSLGSLRPIFLP